jgi:hypothetical protein
MRVRTVFVMSAVGVILPLAAAAQTPRATVDAAECIPVERHSVITAQVADEPGGSTVRLYFRRLHQEIEDFYYVEMNPRGGGEYWAALPKPDDEVLNEKQLADPDTDEERDDPEAAWWVDKEGSDHRDPNDDLNEQIIEERAALGKQVRRDWMLAMSLEELEEFLAENQQEPTELYASVVGPTGEELARSPMIVVPVTPDCEVVMTPVERGQASNLTVGETASWEIDKKVFHWLCDGIVSRIDHQGILRPDGICRACVVAFARPRMLVPASAAVLGITILEPVSPVDP